MLSGTIAEIVFENHCMISTVVRTDAILHVWSNTGQRMLENVYGTTDTFTFRNYVRVRTFVLITEKTEKLCMSYLCST
jgi:hypothetical protein